MNELKLPKNVQLIGYALIAAGYPTYLVGGAVRDFIMGNEPNDFDLCTKAKPGEIIEVITKYFPLSKVNFVGSSFGIIICDGIEIATFRGDRYLNDGDDKNVDISYVDTIEEDLARRDLTINAIAMDFNRELVDPFGGLNDINNKLIRFVGDPNERINEDYNRIIRACRFAARFDFLFHDDTVDALIDNRKKISKIKPERIQKEILKAMELDEPSLFWDLLRTLGFFEIYLKEMNRSYGFDGGKHHAETVWEHMMAVGDALSPNDPILRLAGYLHDIGKPKAYDGERFVGHEKEGQLILLNDLKELKFSNKDIERISGLTRAHMYLLKFISSKSTRKLRNKINTLGIDWRDLTRLRIADAKGNFKSANETISGVKEIVKTFTLVEEEPVNLNSLAVSGGQLIKELELTPGPIVGEIHRELFDFFIETGVADEDCLLLESVRILKNRSNL
jgi:putative nucleotidyltransferase with HDIG domain